MGLVPLERDSVYSSLGNSHQGRGNIAQRDCQPGPLRSSVSVTLASLPTANNSRSAVRRANLCWPAPRTVITCISDRRKPGDLPGVTWRVSGAIRIGTQGRLRKAPFPSATRSSLGHPGARTPEGAPCPCRWPDTRGQDLSVCLPPPPHPRSRKPACPSSPPKREGDWCSEGPPQTFTRTQHFSLSAFHGRSHLSLRSTIIHLEDEAF